MNTQLRREPSAAGRAGMALLLLCTLSGPVAAQVTTGAGPLVRGTVKEAESGIALVAGTVSLLRADGTLAATALTDAEGRYALRPPGPGAYHLRAERVGYHPQERGRFSLQARGTLTVNFELSPAPILMDSLLVTVQRRSRLLRGGEQLVYGRLLDDESGDPIPDGTVRLLTEAGGVAAAAMSDEEGLFFLASPSAGTYRLQAERLGYHTSTGPDLHLMLGDTLGVDFYLSVDAILLNPLVVRATSRPFGDRYDLTGMEDFLRRYSRFARAGIGEFLTRDSIAKYEDRFPTTGQLLAMKTMAVVYADYQSGRVSLGRGCDGPTYYLDGFPLPPQYPLWALTPDMLEGVEVYERGYIPAELNRTGYGTGFPCGVVSYWSRRAPAPWLDVPAWRKVLMGAGVLGLGLLAIIL